jgi:hypothetical protein
MRATDLRFAVAAAAAIGMSACDKYADRRDQVTFGSGDAVTFNKAVQIIDPWPQSSRNITHGMRGEQAEAALAKLRKREAGEEAVTAASPSQLSTAPTTQPK